MFALFSRSRKQSSAKPPTLHIPRRACQTFLLHSRANTPVIPVRTPLPFRAQRGIPPSRSVRGLGGCPPSFRTQRGISPFAERKEAGGCPPSFRTQRGISPSRSVRGLGGCPPSFRARPTSLQHKPALQRAERPSRGARVGIMAIIPTSWQSWFKRVRIPPFAHPCHSEALPCHSERSEESPLRGA